MPSSNSNSNSSYDHLRTIIAYCLIAFANSILPSIAYWGAYLIVPYSRPTVILIQTLPAVLAKLTFPHLGPWVSSRYPPLVVTLGWVSSVFIVYACPPNVTPALRIFGVVIASFTASAAEVLWLGLLRNHGKPGLAGWGLGSGAGGVACVALPYLLTVEWGLFLRKGLGYAWYLVPLALISHYFIMPSPPSKVVDDFELNTKDSEYDAESAAPLLEQPPPKYSTPIVRLQANLDLGPKLLGPFILPLTLAFIGQSTVVPGFIRAMRKMPAFENQAYFATTYGLAFQLGSMAARSSILMVKPLKIKSTLAMVAAAVCVLVLSTYTSLSLGHTLILATAFLAGLGVGGTYIGTLSAALEDPQFESKYDRQFTLGFVGVGEYVGMIIGGLFGASLEAAVCGVGRNDSSRWCGTAQ